MQLHKNYKNCIASANRCSIFNYFALFLVLTKQSSDLNEPIYKTNKVFICLVQLLFVEELNCYFTPTIKEYFIATHSNN